MRNEKFNRRRFLTRGAALGAAATVARLGAADGRTIQGEVPAWKLSDAEVAAVASYIRSAWGNAAATVSASTVGSLRHDLHAAAKISYP